MAQSHTELAREAAAVNISYEDYLLAETGVGTPDRECDEKRIAKSCFPLPQAADQFDFSELPSLNKSKMLELSRGDYIWLRKILLPLIT
jgi:hypothetical protein